MTILTFTISFEQYDILDEALSLLRQHYGLMHSRGKKITNLAKFLEDQRLQQMYFQHT
jgi:hypothetical protein